jgi:hypothetical protein
MPHDPAIEEPTLEEYTQLLYERIHEDLSDLADNEIMKTLTWSEDPKWSPAVSN